MKAPKAKPNTFTRINARPNTQTLNPKPHLPQVSALPYATITYFSVGS